MEFTEISRTEIKKLKKIEFQGRDGKIYLEPTLKLALKLLYTDEERDIRATIDLLSELKKETRLQAVSAIPTDLVYYKWKNQLGFWMKYFDGILFDDWIKQNKHNYDKVFKMYEKISEIFQLLHEQYGIMITDCYYHNIIIIEDQYPILLDVNSWTKKEKKGTYSVSKMLYDYSKRMRWNRIEQAKYLAYSKAADNASLWLMFFESVLDLPVRKFTLKRFPDFLKEQSQNPILIEMTTQISKPNLEYVPYFHEVAKQYSLK